jgi:hypothetical protein
MRISSKFLSAVTLAVALSPLVPLAAHAKRDVPPGPAQYYLAPLHHQSKQNPVRASNITPSSATIGNPTTIYGGVNANSSPDAFGG